MHLLLLFVLCAKVLLCDATTTTTCEGSTLNIKCPAGNIINIHDADYGRHSYLTCIGLPISFNKNCSATDSLEIVKRRCNEQDACSIDVSNSVFGDPCLGTHKYLTVDYTCELIHTELQELITCQDHDMILSCSDGMFLEIIYANYGRSCEDQCPSPGLRTDMNCSAANSSEIVENSCNGLNMCFVNVTNNIFGDPCPSVSKYLEVNYTCSLGRQTTNTTTETSSTTNSTIFEIVKCQNSILDIGCPKGLINIIYANFGRTSLAICPNEGTSTPTQNDNCFNDNSTEILRRSCENNKSCSVNVSSSVFGDTCPGTAKYLEVIYDCEDLDSHLIEKSGCENTILNINCEPGTAIDIVAVVYGRLSNSLCTTGNPGNSNCSAENALGIVDDRCDNKESCAIEASNSVFGDPCPGIEKYLQINYTCYETITRSIESTHPHPTRSPIPITEYACEDTELTIGCPDGNIINVLYANFGRSSIGICPNPGRPTPNCINNNSTEIVRQKCENKELCTVNASSNVFGNDCPITYKYLEVIYTCELLDPALSNESACENTSLTITCETGTTIDIVNAVYGRLSNSVCNSTNSGNLNCSAEDALTIVEDSCDNKDSCTIEASNGVFGNPCPGIDKYLQINYTCFQTINTTPNISASPTTHTPTPTTPSTILPKNPTPRPKHTVVACQNTMLAIGCPTGYINILFANFGRLSAAPCNFGNGNQTCVNDNSTEIVRRNCENKKNCFISASTSVFGNSCPGTSNYLEVVYSCEDSNSILDPQEKSACENTSLTITCETGTTIDIVNAVYGRLSNSVCNSTNSGNLNCSAEDALTIVEDSCDNKDSCTIEASNGVFGNPCPGIDKYLQINYTCFQTINTTPNISASPTTHTPTPTTPSTILPKNPTPRPNNKSHEISTCENSSLTITCDAANTAIDIIGGVYGRVSNSLCVTTNPGSLNCSAEDALRIIEDSCDDKKTCTVEASSQIFGDPCSGIAKYLQINYTCIQSTGPTLGPGNGLVILNVTACEDTNLTIACPATDYIFVYKANYGRTSFSICNSTSSDQNINCTSPRSTSIVADRCDGLNTCTINASDSEFPDTCASTFKYLEVEYVCLHRITTEIPLLNKTACENTTLSINCSTDATINITSANYGRTNSLICPRVSQDQIDNCTDPNSYKTVSNRCTGQESCSIQATNSEFGSDPCPGTFKYLEVEYDCINKVDTIPFSGTACDGVTLELECSAGLNIEVLAANYGRLSNSICPKQGVDNVNNCSSVNATDIVSQRCNGAENCSIQASNSTFGDPCPGIYKYLIVYYSCIGSYIQCGINEHINCSNHCTNRFCGSAITESCTSTCDQGCVCNEGYNRDPLTGICINTKYCPLKGQPCQTHEHFTRCGADCQSTCSNATQTCENCSPGYICNSGFVRDEDIGRCVRPEDCPCSAPVAVT